jgi:hypothetical protein
MPRKAKKKSIEDVADELTAIAVEHLDKLPSNERQRRIKALEKRVATFSSKRRLSGSTPASSVYTQHYPLDARGRERS